MTLICLVNLASILINNISPQLKHLSSSTTRTSESLKPELKPEPFNRNEDFSTSEFVYMLFAVFVRNPATRLLLDHTDLIRFVVSICPFIASETSCRELFFSGKTERNETSHLSELWLGQRTGDTGDLCLDRIPGNASIPISIPVFLKVPLCTQEHTLLVVCLFCFFYLEAP